MQWNAVSLLQNNWFRRNQEKLQLTPLQEEFITAALGEVSNNWQASPDVQRTLDILNSNPAVLDGGVGEALLARVVAMRGCERVVQALLEQGVRVSFDESEYNQVHEAAWANAHENLDLMFQHKAANPLMISIDKPHTGWPDDLSLLYWAAWGAFLKLAKVLIKHGADAVLEHRIRGNGERGTTVLQEACAPSLFREAERVRDRMRVADYFIEKGAEYDILSACARDDVGRITKLLAIDSEAATRPDSNGMTPMHWAVRANATKAVKLLLDEGASVDPLNRAQRTPLQLAAEKDAVAAIEILCEKGADVDTQDKKGRTPLHRACYDGNPQAAETLLSYGASPLVLNKNGRTAFEIARKDAKYFKSRV